ncbi:sensor histidine kinase N-terminal domain-containing protein [Mitsuaria sp. WAJ17]|uniref:sensor histidine kinase n=1 Tax=Mitsuaria sp. WAJ17 TaxID=2761452 RepID=UPI0015FFA10E|nr:sensor histidine kinase [Mitsuaria sp. WAJ17]MBB2488089.1 sensor histidine kinase N-terminal domain-containing protein [Mitsuaria sp. WAJ17]
MKWALRRPRGLGGGLEGGLRWRLLAPLLGVVLVASVLSAHAASGLIDAVFDRWLLDAARSLASQVQFEQQAAVIALNRQAQAVLTYDADDRTYFSVLEGDHVLAGEQHLPRSGSDVREYDKGAQAFEAPFLGHPVRVVWVQLASAQDPARVVLVGVGETLNKRRRVFRELLWVYAPVGLIVIVAAWILLAAVRRTLRPLQRMADQWNTQSHASLMPIPTAEVPRELLPFALALNELLGRLREVLEREKLFASAAAHQLRTPLTGLQLGLARAAEAPDLAATRAVLAGLQASTQRTARLVQQLLALSRLDPELASSPDFARVDLHELARAVGESFLEIAHDKGLTMELIEAGDAGAAIVGHPDLLSEALGNLIDNAIRYTPAGGTIRITVQTAPPGLTITDSGPGIPADELVKVMLRFYRGRQASGQGSGLGLAIVKEIANLHHAGVSLKNMDEGGLQVRIVFPAPGQLHRF